MNPWYAITLIGAPDLWAWICGLLVILYLLFRPTILKGHPVKRKQFKGAVILFILSFAITFGTIYLMKAGFNIPRSCIVCPAPGCNPYCLPDSSFPSGHAATIFTFFTSFSIVTRSRWNLAILALAVLVAGSRIALGVHTLADVVAGAAFGMLVVILVWRLERHLRLGQITPK